MTIRLAEPPPPPIPPPPIPPPPIPAPPIPAPAGWEGILAPGEVILWQGRPDGALVIRPGHIASAIFGLAFAAFALFWMLLAAKEGGYSWTFGLLHFSAGVGVMVGGPLGSLWQRRHKWYTLTNARAIIASDMPVRGRRLDSYPITADMELRMDEIGDFANLYFAETSGGDSDLGVQPIGFDRIAEGRLVMDLMRAARLAVQKGGT